MLNPRRSLPNYNYDSMAMSIRLSLQIIFFLTSSTIILMLYYSKYSETPTITRILRFPGIVSGTTLETNLRPGFAILSPQCKMLNPDPWDESIQKYLYEPKPLICSRLPLLTSVDQQDDFVNILKVNKKVLNKYKVRPNHVIKCCYHVIKRINQNADNYNSSADSLYELSQCINFTDVVYLSNNEEFILVKCQSHQKDKHSGKEVYRNVHAMIPFLPSVVSKPIRSQSKRTERRLNVVVLGIDSMSKLNLRRVMPRTLRHLQENGWVELNGYNKVGENTFPNLMGILSGEEMNKLDEMCLANHTKKMDDCPSIWKDYKRMGYVTLYAEDTPAISTFNLLRTGFVEKPTDYYMRPFMVAAHELLPTKNVNGLPVCLGPVVIVDHILDYARRFFRVFNARNYFALLWLNSLSHNDVNAPRALDASVHKFLREISSTGVYEDSLILVLSDHGVRFGYIRETFLGYLEERLPFMFIWVPKWFRKTYPERYKNLRVNQNRLTSPYDVYVTIKKLLDGEDSKRDGKPVSKACPKCRGLLEEQPLWRNCADASVELNWCLCSEFKNVGVKDDAAVQTGTFLYKFIVKHTKSLMARENVTKTMCSKWKFLRIYSTQEIIVPENVELHYSLRSPSNGITSRHVNRGGSPNMKIFVIIIELNPGRTKFESTIRMEVNANGMGPKFDFLEPPKRLDSIYKTSKCVTSTLLKHYCYCLRR